MKLNTPITPEEHAAADENYKELALAQKEYLRQLADKLEKDEPLTKCDRETFVLLARDKADQISTKRKRPKGQPAKVPDMFPLWFRAHLSAGKSSSKNEALEHFSKKYGVSREALKKRLEDPAAVRMVETFYGKT